MADDLTTGGAGPLDGMFRDTNIVILILFGICCSGIAFILGLIGYLTGKSEKAKSNALIVTIVGAVSGGLVAVLNFMGLMGTR